MSYTTYRSLDELWLTNIPKHWDSRKIKYVFSERVEKGYSDEPLLVASQNMGVVPKGVYGNRTVEATKDLHNLKLVRIGDFVISLRSFQGGLEYAYYQGIISPAYTVMIPNNHITSGYFRYLAKSRMFIELLQMCVTGIREGQNIDYGKLKNHLIPLPPRNEQDQIVRFLDWKVSQINRLINAKRRQIGLLREQKQAVINEMVTKGGDGWEEIRLGNLGTFRKGFGGTRVDDCEDGVACIRYGDIYRAGTMSLFQPITRISEQVSFSYARVYKSEILFALSGETKEEIGQALINNINENTWCSGDAAIFKANNRIIPQLLVYILRCPYVVKQRASLANGDIIVHISVSDLRQLRIIVPSITEQEQILVKLERLSSSIDSIIKAITNQIPILIEYRTRLISDVVTGKLDVRDVVVPEYISEVEDSVSDGEDVDSESTEDDNGEEI